jgi:raffinose synthase
MHLRAASKYLRAARRLLFTMNQTLLLSDGELRAASTCVLRGVPGSVTAEPDPKGAGVFLRFQSEEDSARHVWTLGRPGAVRWVACHRHIPFWMQPAVGTRAAQVPTETQYWLGEWEGGYGLLVPLLDGAWRAALQGNAETEELEVVAESGDPSVRARESSALFVAFGPDPFQLMEEGAASCAAWMKAGRLRRDKTLPRWADLFGWCTWDAFYHDVSPDKVREGLQSFADGGVRPRLLILDDGWQTVRDNGPDGKKLSAFSPNEKFGGDLGPTVEMSRREFGIETFLVWHALNGYWGGVDPDAGEMQKYSPRAVVKRSSPAVLEAAPNLDEWWGGTLGLVPGEQAHRFFHDYHRELRAQGVDGVKVDVQTQLESAAVGEGGRVVLTRRYHEALEGSVAVHFGGNLLNCMSCSNEALYSTAASTIARTSDDFYPDKPASHGAHLWVNAFVSLWFGEFIHPDWDMFQSAHALGAFHAAGRVLSGGPIYVSDKPGQHDFALLKKLAFPDGTVPRAAGIGRPTRDCLFADPTNNATALKIFNLNEHTGTTGGASTWSGLLGAWNLRSPEEAPGAISGAARPGDIEGLPGDSFAVYAHHADELRACGRDESWEFSLPPLGHEVWAVAPIVNGFAPIGLKQMLNAGGAIKYLSVAQSGVEVQLRAGGAFVAWSEREPARIEAGGAEIEFSWRDGRLELEAPGAGTLRISW